MGITESGILYMVIELLSGCSLRDGTLRFFHADGTEYGTAPVPAAADARARAFRALRGLGFKDGEAPWALAHAPHVAPETAEALVRRCLLLLTEGWARAS